MAFLAENEHVDRGRSPKRLFQQRKQKNPAQTEAGSNVLILAHQQSKKYAVRPLCLLKAAARSASARNDPALAVLMLPLGVS